MDLYSIGASNMQPMNGAISGGMGSLETGQFDFFEYFLGLQGTNPDGSLTGLPQIGATNPEGAISLKPDVSQAVAQTLQSSTGELSLAGKNLQLLGGLVPGKEQLQSQVHATTAEKLDGSEVFLKSAQGGPGQEALSPAQLDVANQLRGAQLAGMQSSEQSIQQQAGQVQMMDSMDEGVELDVQGIRSPGEELSLFSSGNAVEMGPDSPVVKQDFSLNPVVTNPLNLARADVAGEVKMPEVHIPQESLQEVANGIQNLRDAGGGKMKIALNPPELGQVEIEVTNHGKDIGVEIRSENVGTKSLLESNLGSLRTAILAQDLNVSKLEVHQGNLEQEWERNDSMMSFEEHSQGESEQGQNRQNLSRYEQASESLSVASSPALAGPRGTSRVDLRV